MVYAFILRKKKSKGWEHKIKHSISVKSAFSEEPGSYKNRATVGTESGTGFKAISLFLLSPPSSPCSSSSFLYSPSSSPTPFFYYYF